jgi:signal transduction histidine kinase
LRREAVDIDLLVADVASKAAPLVTGRLEITSGPAGGQISVDPQRLTQALINLLRNAAQHTPDNTKIELGALAVEDRWRFEVTDHGDGVSSDDVESVFLPFCTGASQAPGNGLGLAIVRGIARAHGGATGLDNRPGSGATFWLEVPQ